MTAFQGKPYAVTFRAADPVTGDAVTGIPFSGPVVRYWPAALNTYVTKTLVSADWQELGDGYYRLFFNTELTALGNFVYQVTDASFVPVVGSFDVDPQPTAFLAAPGLCVVTGNIVDLGARPGVGTEVTFRIAAAPAAVSGSLVAGGLIGTVPDAYGNFSVALLQGSTLIVEIAEVGLKQTFTVPLQTSASLVSLLPPI